MLRALGHPTTFLGLLAGFLLAAVVHRAVVALALRAAGDRAALRSGLGLPRSLDPYGAVAAALAGPGWGAPAPITASVSARGFGLRPPVPRVLATLAGPIVVAALGIAVLAAFPLVGGDPQLRALVPPTLIVAGIPLPAAQSFVLGLGLQLVAMAVLQLVPLPPLTGWLILDRLAPRSKNWDTARHWLVERNIGVVVLLVLLLFPLGGTRPLLLAFVDGVSLRLLGAIW